MRHYTHFTTEERELSRVLLAQGFSLRAIARKLNRRRRAYAENLLEILRQTLHIQRITRINSIKNDGEIAAGDLF